MAKVEVTGELIKSAIAKRVLEVVPDAAGKVYKETQQQNIGSADGFYIVQRSVRQFDLVKPMVRREYDMILRYEPDINSQTALEKCALMGNILMFALRVIYDGNGVAIHGNSLSMEIVDNALLIYVTYHIRIKMEKDDFNPMETLDIIKEVND